MKALNWTYETCGSIDGSWLTTAQQIVDYMPDNIELADDLDEQAEEIWILIEKAVKNGEIDCDFDYWPESLSITPIF